MCLSFCLESVCCGIFLNHTSLYIIQLFFLCALFSHLHYVSVEPSDCAVSLYDTIDKVTLDLLYPSLCCICTLYCNSMKNFSERELNDHMTVDHVTEMII